MPNSKISSIFDHVVRNSSTIKSIYQQDAELDRLRSELAEVRAEIAWEQVSDLEEPDTFSFPSAQSSEPEPLLSWEEQKRQAVSAFTDEWTRAYMAQEPLEQEPSVMYFDNNKVHNISESKVVMQWKEQIREAGEITEIGGGGSWYDRTASLFDLMYHKAYDATIAVVDRAKDYWDSWQRYLTERDKDRDPDREPDIDFDR